MTDDAYTRDVFDKLSIQPESSQFFRELEERMRTGDRLAIARWRRTALVAVAVAAAAVAAAGVMASTLSAAASTVVDQTVVCTNIVKAGIPVFEAGGKPTGEPQLDASGHVRKPPPGFYPPTSMWVQTGDVSTLLIFSSQASGYQLDPSRCLHSKLKLALGPHGLPPALTLNMSDQEQFGKRCTAVAKMAMRFQLTTDSLGVPLRAKLLIARAKTGKALVYMDWTRNSLHSWAAPNCETYLSNLP